MTTALDTARSFIARGWSPVPVEPRSKACNLKGWPQLRITEANIKNHFNGMDQNIGVLTGKPSGNLADVDLDCDEAVALAPYFLPESDAVFGRDSRRQAHWLYVAGGTFTSLKLVDPELCDKEATIVELRGDGKQTVFPGSVHESGEPITWDSEGDPARVHATDLIHAVQRIAAATVLVRHWTEGVHDDLCTSVVGCLLRAGWPDDEIENFIAAIVEVAGDPKLDKRLEKIARLRRKWTDGDSKGVPGFPRLAEDLGSETAAKTVAQWIGLRLTQSFKLTDLGNAERLVAGCGADWRWLPEVGWIRWDGVRWADDREGRIAVMAAETVRGIDREVADEADDGARKALRAWAHKSESRKALEAMVALARQRPEIVDLLDRYDQQPYLLAVRNGVLDLASGQFRAGQHEDRLRLRADCEFDASATAPRFQQFLLEIFDGDADLISFMARALGYSVGGSNAEQVLFIAHGGGANGKSTLINVVRRLLGDYAKTIQPETLLARERAAIPNDIARLRGVRFVPTVEVEDGKKLAESLVKQMTGGDAISARFLRCEFFDFVPVAKLWIATNHRPVISGTDWAIWRRIVLVPFKVTIPPEQRDKELEEKLIAEGPGVLNWLLAGFQAWRALGLAPPQSVLAATEQYRKDMDRVGLFLKERTQQNVGRVKCSDVYVAYAAWCKDANVRLFSRPRFRDKAVNEHALHIVTRDGYEHYDGLALVEEGDL